ncbi:MAG TPA: alpha/beta hydrolase [Solirubrobacteraceae bacterium]|nr:alpha/beta hydrolase [Solirubrobacteraceae bacterium]
MLAYDRTGTGPTLLLLHGTNSSRSIWKPLLPRLSAERDVLAVDLPGHGQSPPSSFTPPAWADDIAAFLDELGLRRVIVVGHSSGGWTALELAKRGRARAVLALAPAGLWRRHSPLVTDAILDINWRTGQLLGERALAPLRTGIGRRIALRQISARPAEVGQHEALVAARAALASKHFPEHFSQTRRLRFLNGKSIPVEVPIHIVWGDQDHIAGARRSRYTDQLPVHATVETWQRCGHMLMWDDPGAVLAAALALSAGSAAAAAGSPATTAGSPAVTRQRASDRQKLAGATESGPSTEAPRCAHW